MREKQKLAIRLLAFGIALEIVLLAGLLLNPQENRQDRVANAPDGSRGEEALPFSDQDGGLEPTIEIVDTPADLSGPPVDPEMMQQTEPPPDPPGDEAPPLDPALDSDHPPGSEPSDSGGPVNGYPAPGSDGGYSGAWESYPAPPADSNPPPDPTQPPAQPAPTQPPQPTIQVVPPATATQPPATAQPSPTAVPAQPTATIPSGGPPPGEAGALVSARAGSAPVLDGRGDDAAWNSAPETVIETTGGANASATRVSLRSVYDGERVYFLVSWADPTNSWLRAPWEKQPDGAWKRLVSPQNEGNDESVYDEDKIALLWPVDDSIPGFAEQGCGTACHAGENAGDKPYGSMYTAKDGQLADLWNWKATRSLGQLDDLYLDSTRYSKDSYWAGFQRDPGMGGYVVNRTEDGDAPAYMPYQPGAKDGWPGFIYDLEKVPLDDSRYAPGERVPSALVAPFTGDRGDISAAWRYADGRWTLEFSRPLVTGSPYDVQFDDLSRLYSFALATFDNTQIRHATQGGALSFRFQP